MTDWIDALADKTKQKYAQQRMAEEKFVLEQRQRKAAGEQFVRELRQILSSAQDEYNSKMGGSPVVSILNEGDGLALRANLTNHEQRLTVLRHDPDLHNLYVTQKTPSGSEEVWAFVVVNNAAKAEWTSGRTSTPPIQLSSEELGKYLFEMLLH